MTDPVLDFLAREQDALADLGDEFAPAIGNPASANLPIENGFALQNGDSPAAPILNGVSHGRGDSGVDLSALDINDSNANASSPVLNGRGPSPGIAKEEPEKIKKWREDQKKMIDEKDKAEEKKKEELRQQAKKELQDWHAQRAARLEQRKKENRERETAHFNGDVTENGGTNTFERIAKMIDSKSTRGTKDTSRMKALFTQYAEAPPKQTS